MLKIYTYIGSESDYNDKFDQAEYAYEREDWRTAFGCYNACFDYASKNGKPTSYLEMKMEDCREHF